MLNYYSLSNLRLLLLTLSSFLLFYLSAQELNTKESKYDSYYGLDPNLVTGEKYEYHYYGALGHPFLHAKTYSMGTVWGNSMEFGNQTINLEILKNQVLLQTTNQNGYTRNVILSHTNIDSFLINTTFFRKLNLPKHGIKFVEVTKRGSVSFAVYYSKHLKVNSGLGSQQHSFTEADKQLYAIVDSKPIPVNTKRQLFKLFPGHKTTLKQLIKKHKLKLKKPNSQSLYRFTRDFHKVKMEGKR